jgi:hypothetical protein
VQATLRAPKLCERRFQVFDDLLSDDLRRGQRSHFVTADTYTHVLLDDRELAHAELADGRP